MNATTKEGNSNECKWSRNITPLLSTTLNLPPSCIEFVPEDEGQHFVVGTYNLQGQLDEADQSSSQDASSKSQARDGSILLFKLRGEELILIQTLSYLSAILDLHFFGNTKTFAVASSTGAVSIFKVVDGEDQFGIYHLATHQVLPQEVLVLSLAWYPFANRTDQEKSPTLAITTSDGGVSTIRLTSDFKSFTLVNEVSLISHDEEAWTCAVTENMLFSGGDDSKLCRIIFEQDALEVEGKIIFRGWFGSRLEEGEKHITEYKCHAAGVTAILILPTATDCLDSIILTGSYDDHVQVYTTAGPRTGMPPGSSKILAKLYIGGGVWRLKMMRIRQSQPGEFEYIVLASCMHSGARILEVKGSSDGGWSIDILAEMRGHESMCYASDVQPQPDVLDPHLGSSGFLGEQGQLRRWVVVSTSFYDKLLRVWEWDSQAVL